MNINLREDATTQYISFYQRYLEDVQTLNNKVMDILNEVMQQSKYDKLQHRISGIIDAYMETIVNNIETGVFQTWQESEGSLRSCLRTYRAGDAADEVCAQIEQQMEDLMQDILKIEKADLIVTERPVVSEDGLEQLEDICRTAQTEIQNLKTEYASQVLSEELDNDIYGTLRPLIEGVATNIEAFFEASLNSFIELHEFVSGISTQLHDIAEENGINVGRVNKKVGSTLTELASSMKMSDKSKSLSEFKKVTKLLYDTICSDTGSKNKKLSYEMIAQIMPIYHKFYSDFGEILKDKFSSQDEREEFVKREYIAVTRERDNDKFFDGEEAWTFKSHAHHTYTVFDRVADMEKNIAEGCINGTANDVNLLYGAYVLFTPILEGHISEVDGKKFEKFSKWASDEIIRILGIEKNDNDLDDENTEIDFRGENFSAENIKLFVIVVEKIVGQVGEEELNKEVERHYNHLSTSRSVYSRRASKATTQEHNISANTYGRYTVTNKSIQMMAPICMQVNSILEPIDKFYKEKFEKLESGYDKANKIIHAMSSFVGLWGLGTWNLSKMFSTEDSDSSILEKVQLGGLALASCSTAGKIIMGGAHMVKILDWAMPYLKKSKTLVKLSEKVWNLTRQDIQIPYVHKMMDQYLMEHYEIKYGMTKGQSPCFAYYHNVAIKIEDEHQRRAFENAVFSAETVLTPQNYVLSETDPLKSRAICCGVFLNLVRSGMCSKQDIESGTANDIVDKLYDTYVSMESITPRVEIDPGKRMMG